MGPDFEAMPDDKCSLWSMLYFSVNENRCPSFSSLEGLWQYSEAASIAPQACTLSSMASPATSRKVIDLHQPPIETAPDYATAERPSTCWRLSDSALCTYSPITFCLEEGTQFHFLNISNCRKPDVIP